MKLSVLIIAITITLNSCRKNSCECNYTTYNEQGLSQGTTKQTYLMNGLSKEDAKTQCANKNSNTEFENVSCNVVN